MSSWHSYTSMYNLGHRLVSDIFKTDVIIEEKIDGSQFNFGLINGELMIKSKGAAINVDNPEKMFSLAVEHVIKRKHLLIPEWTYRGEYLRTSNHNTLKYNRTPIDNIIIFDIATDEEVYLSYIDKKKESERLGFEVVPLLFEGIVKDKRTITDFMSLDSCLGGVKIEGYVIKNYSMFNPLKKILVAKHVSEAFKEVHEKSWKEKNPSKSDFILTLASRYRTDARWNKTIHHLRDDGKLTDSPKDIGILLKEIKDDTFKECKEEIKDELFNYFQDNIGRLIISGFPDYYKNYLLEKQCEELK